MFIYSLNVSENLEFTGVCWGMWTLTDIVEDTLKDTPKSDYQKENKKQE